MDQTRLSGILLIVAGAQFLIGILLSESLYPGYSVPQNYLSDLGTPGMPSAPVFTGTVMVLGLLGVVAALLLWNQRAGRFLPAMLLVTSLGSLGVAIFPETTGLPHIVFALVSFIAGTMTVISSSRVTVPPFSFVAPVLGLVSVTALILLVLPGPRATFPGFMEKMIVYPLVTWQIAFGGYLVR